MRTVLGMMLAAFVLTVGAPGTALGQSCEGKCGQWASDPGGGCDCSSYCPQDGTCCSDFSEQCPLSAAVGETCPVNSAAGLACGAAAYLAVCADNLDLGFCTLGLSFCAENPEVCAGAYLDQVEYCAGNPEACTLGLGSLVEYCAANPEACAGLYTGFVEYCAGNPEACLGL